MADMMSISNLLSDLTALLFPKLCSACNLVLYKGEKEICTSCMFNLPYTDFHLYPDNLLMKQFWGRVPIDAATALLYFRKSERTQNLIHQLKYKGRTGVGILLGNKIGESLLLSNSYQNIDMIVPVPLHPKKKLLRGYNQSSFIAEGIAEVLKVPVYDKILARKIATETQTKKDRYKRFKSLEAVFAVNKKYDISEKHILLVDDVVTTGATLEACAIALQAQKIRKLSVAAAAYVK